MLMYKRTHLDSVWNILYNKQKNIVVGWRLFAGGLLKNVKDFKNSSFSTVLICVKTFQLKFKNIN